MQGIVRARFSIAQHSRRLPERSLRDEPFGGPRAGNPKNVTSRINDNRPRLLRTGTRYAVLVCELNMEMEIRMEKVKAIFFKATENGPANKTDYVIKSAILQPRQHYECDRHEQHPYLNYFLRHIPSAKSPGALH
ncbi:hypothetical protein EVAR_20133_1 [Eumeta japonica]|uniref:Uncharacterized protein n=1 Tax=Eumeta variegata TaxID=151549 RepID=A0A4C1V2C1_EUMVA|nr:hypothetical protein EVAR_20133_1 [Eumeta japonica]